MKSNKTEPNLLFAIILVLCHTLSVTAEASDDELRILSVGIGGQSSFNAAHLLSGRKEEKQKIQVTMDEGRRLTLITGPNLCEEDTARESFTTALLLSSPGPHAVLIHLNLEDQPPEQCDLLQQAQELLGEEVLQHCIVLLQQHWTGASRETAGQMISACGGRFHIMTNSQTALLAEIDKLFWLNGGKFHSTLNATLQIEAERLELQRRLKEIENILDKANQYVHQYVHGENPHMQAEYPHMHKENQHVHAENPHVHKENQPVHAENQHVHAGNPRIHAENQHVHAENQHMHAENPHIHAENQHVHAENQHVHAENPHVHKEKQPVHAENQHVHAENQHVHAEKQHVYAEYPHIHAENQHVHAENQHVHAENQHMHAENPHIHAENQHVHAENQHVHAENQHVHAENQHVHVENQHVHAENPHIHAENQHVHAENPHMHKEKQPVHAENQHVHAENQLVYAENQHVHAENQHVHAENPHIHAENQHVHAENPHMHKEKQPVHAENQHVHAENQLVYAEYPHIHAENQQVHAENQHMHEEKPLSFINYDTLGGIAGIVGWICLISLTAFVIYTEGNDKMLNYMAKLSLLILFMVYLRHFLRPDVAILLNFSLLSSLVLICTHELNFIDKPCPIENSRNLKESIAYVFLYAIVILFAPGIVFFTSFNLALVFGSFINIRTWSDVLLACCVAPGVSIGAYALKRKNSMNDSESPAYGLTSFLWCLAGGTLSLGFANVLFAVLEVKLTIILAISTITFFHLYASEESNMLTLFVLVLPCGLVLIGSVFPILGLMMSFLKVIIQSLISPSIVYIALFSGSVIAIWRLSRLIRNLE